MSLVPAFEIGIWNAWIFMLYHFLPIPLLWLVRRSIVREIESPHSDIEKRLYPYITILWLLALIYSVFLPFRLGTIWLYVGLPVAMVGLIGYTLVVASWITNPMENKPIIRGIYRYSRHPFYVFQMIMLIGIGVASASWVFMLFTIIYSVLHFIIAIPEERQCLEKYGDTYREYMNRTPRWIGIPKS